MFRVYCILIGYMVGCFQTAFLVGRFSKNIDIRHYGSGNAGSTNVLRVLGVKAGVITFLGDLLKAVAGFTICTILFPAYTPLSGLYAGIGVILGHNWPVFLRFKGGKGIASTIGILLAVDWRIGLLGIAIGGITIYLTRYVSLASILLSICIPILLAVFKYPVEAILTGMFFAISAIWRHQSNIQRLLSGNESKLGQKGVKK